MGKRYLQIFLRSAQSSKKQKVGTHAPTISDQPTNTASVWPPATLPCLDESLLPAHYREVPVTPPSRSPCNAANAYPSSILCPVQTLRTFRALLQRLLLLEASLRARLLIAHAVHMQSWPYLSFTRGPVTACKRRVTVHLQSAARWTWRSQGEFLVPI